ncbi:MAG: hypothetical protein WBB31_00535 [Saprospiraceae bacterium]
MQENDKSKWYVATGKVFNDMGCVTLAQNLILSEVDDFCGFGEDNKTWVCAKSIDFGFLNGRFHPEDPL